MASHKSVHGASPTLTLDELRALMDAASPAPWRHNQCGKHAVERDEIKAPRSPSGGEEVIILDVWDEKDAALIVAMRNALPALLARLREMEGALKNFRALEKDIDIRAVRDPGDEWETDADLRAQLSLAFETLRAALSASSSGDGE